MERQDLSQLKCMQNAIGYQAARPLGAHGLPSGVEDPGSAGQTRGLAVDVFYTTDAGTQRALEKAGALTKDLGAHLRLVFVYAVPYALPLTAPAVSIPFLQDKLVKLAGSYSRESSVRIYLCRDTFRALSNISRRSSLVILGGRRRWWPTKEQRLEKQLKKLGHQVIFVEGR